MLNSTLIIIVDDHEPGQLSFPERFYTVKESQQCAIVPVSRTYARETNACFVSAELWAMFLWTHTSVTEKEIQKIVLFFCA